MVRALISIKVEAGKEKLVRGTLSSIKGVTDVFLTTGEYDLIAMVTSDVYQDVMNLLMAKIRAIDGVLHTNTSFILE